MDSLFFLSQIVEEVYKHRYNHNQLPAPKKFKGRINGKLGKLEGPSIYTMVFRILSMYIATGKPREFNSLEKLLRIKKVLL